MPSLAQKITSVLVSAVLALLILMAGQIPWSALLVLNFRNRTSAVPWSVLVMAVLLWLIWNYLGGKGWARSTSEKRRRLLRANPVPPKTFALSFLCGVLAVVALAGYWIVFFQLVKTPANVLADTSMYPLLTVILVTAMLSLVSPISEEIAFRGYAQQILESRFSAGAAVLLSSLMFMLAHANHGLYWPKLTVYFLAGVVFGTITLLTNSILTTLPVHIVGDVTFFVLIWPHDAARMLVAEAGADKWFWVHVMQAIVFTLLALMGFWYLKKQHERVLAPA